MEKETKVYVKDGLRPPVYINKSQLILDISQGIISKEALWSSNQLIWAPLSSLPGLNVNQIQSTSGQKQNIGVFTSLLPSTKNGIELSKITYTPLRIAVFIAAGGVLAISVMTIMLLLSSNDGNNKNSIQTEAAEQKDKKNEKKINMPKNQNLPDEFANKKQNQIFNRKFDEVFNPLPLGGKAGQKIVFAPEEIFENFSPSVAQIFHGNPRRGVFTGSGFLVAPGLLVTNNHVVSEKKISENVTVIFHSAKGKESGKKTGVIVKKIPSKDLAFIKVDTELPFLRLSKNLAVKPGQQIVAIGSPGIGDGVLPNTIAQGLVGQVVIVNDMSMLQLSIAVNPGNSGGPAIGFNGETFGVITLKGRNVDGIAFCVPSGQVLEEIKELIQE